MSICTGHNTNTADTQICMPRVRFEPTIPTAKRWKTGRFGPRCHCDWYVFHFLLQYFFRGFTFHLEPQHRTSTFSRPVTYTETRHKNHLLCTSVSLHGRVVTDLACHTEDGTYSCLSHEPHSAQLTRLLSSVIWIFRGHVLHSTLRCRNGPLPEPPHRLQA